MSRLTFPFHFGCGVIIPDKLVRECHYDDNEVCRFTWDSKGHTQKTYGIFLGYRYIKNGHIINETYDGSFFDMPESTKLFVPDETIKVALVAENPGRKNPYYCTLNKLKPGLDI